MKLRPRQVDFVHKINYALNDKGNTLGVAPTGAGKTVMLSAAIKAAGLSSGIAMNPDADPRRVLPYLGDVDLVLCMTVFPGFGGQAFIPGATETIRGIAEARERLGLSFRIEVDGGINAETAATCRAAGADTLVAGTAFFKAGDRAAAARAMAGA
jgi:ribulose-phosphate 3-epimerase